MSKLLTCCLAVVVLLCAATTQSTSSNASGALWCSGKIQCSHKLRDLMGSVATVLSSRKNGTENSMELSGKPAGESSGLISRDWNRYFGVRYETFLKKLHNAVPEIKNYKAHGATKSKAKAMAKSFAEAYGFFRNLPILTSNKLAWGRPYWMEDCSPSLVEGLEKTIIRSNTYEWSRDGISCQDGEVVVFREETGKAILLMGGHTVLSFLRSSEDVIVSSRQTRTPSAGPT